MIESMSITKALAECKILDDRINKKIQSFLPIKIQLGENSLIDGIEKNEFEQDVKSKYQSILDLINRRKIIKSKIIESNSKTKIKINNMEITVAEAIDYKNIIDLKKQLLHQLRVNKNIVDNSLSEKSEIVQNRLDDLLKVNFGKDKAKIDKESYESISKPFLAKNLPIIVDPISIQSVIDQLDDEIDKFILDIDYILSESNSKITIELI